MTELEFYLLFGGVFAIIYGVGLWMEERERVKRHAEVKRLNFEMVLRAGGVSEMRIAEISAMRKKLQG